MALKIGFDNEELLSQADKFYESIEESFELTYKNKDKNGLDKSSNIEVIRILWMFLFVMCVAPLIPALLAFKLIPDFTANITSNPVINYFIIWSGCLVITYPIKKIFDSLEKKHIENIRKISLNENQMVFCYLYKSIKEIQLYLENNRTNHIDNTKKFLLLYFYRTDLNIMQQFPEFPPGTYRVRSSYRYALDLNKKHSWFKLNESTQEIIISLNDSENKIFERLIQIYEVNRIVKPLQILLEYEFLKVKNIPEEILQTLNINYETYPQQCLLRYAGELNKLSQLEPKVTETEKKEKKINVVYKFILNTIKCYQSESVLVSFLFWFITLLILTVVLARFLVLKYHITVDSTIIIGVISIPLLGAAALSSGIFARKGK